MNPGEIQKRHNWGGEAITPELAGGTQSEGEGQDRSLQEQNLTSGLRTLLTLSSAQSCFPAKRRDTITREAQMKAYSVCVHVCSCL